MKSTPDLAAIDAAGNILAECGERISLAYRPSDVADPFMVMLEPSYDRYALVSGFGPTPRDAYAAAHAKRVEAERKHAIEQQVRARIEAETEAEYARQYQRGDARQEAGIIMEQNRKAA